MKTIIEDFTVTDVLGDVSTNPVLNAIKDSKISDLVDDINDIYLGDIMTGLYTDDHVTWYTDSEKTVKADVLTNKMAGYQIGNIGTLKDGINDMYLGEIMGLEILKADYDAVNKVYIYNEGGTAYWVKRLVTDTKANVYDSYPATFHKKTVDATTYYYQYDELLAVLAKYQVKDISNGTMVNALLTDVKGLKVKNFFDQTDSGLMSMVDPEWKIEELPTKLDEKMDNATVLEMIKFGAFGDYYPTAGFTTDADYYAATGVGYESYDDTDAIFKSTPAADTDDNDNVTEAEARIYWLGVKMNDFMGLMMTSIKSMSNNIPSYYTIYLPTAAGETYEVTALAYNKYSEGGYGTETYATTLTYFKAYRDTSAVDDYNFAQYMKAYRAYVDLNGVTTFPAYNTAIIAAGK